MINDHSNEINIDEIVKKIKAEINVRKNAASRQGRDDDVVHPKMSQTTLFRFIKKVQWKINKYPFYNAVYKAAIRFKRIVPRLRENVDIKDLLRYQDQSFIKNAYRVILKREPDARSFDYFLSQLRRAQLSKAEIIGRLRYSKEGRENGVSVKGLFYRFVLHTAYRLPFLGYLLMLFATILTLPLMERREREQEVLNDMRYAEIKVGLKGKTTELNEKITAVSDRIRIQELHVLEEVKKLTALLEQAKWQSPKLLSDEQVSGILNEEDHLLDALYVSFEDNFRGTRESIKERAKTYLPYIERIKAAAGNALVLDLGCGRGEWLELLKENGVTARGIDLNRIMVEQCRRLGFDVAEADALSYLHKQPSQSLAAVTGFHLVEHLALRDLVGLLDESYRVLQPGGMLIFETPNPENIIVGTCNFYMDPTHKNPIPPDTLKFLVEFRGFTKTEIVRLHPLNYFPYDKDDEIKHLVYRFNMEQDYSLVAVRPG